MISSEPFKKWRLVIDFKGVHEKKNWAHIAILFEAGWVIVQLKDFEICWGFLFIFVL